MRRQRSSASALLQTGLQTLNRFSRWLLFLAICWLAWVAARLVWLLIAPPIAPALPLVAIQSHSKALVDNSPLFTIFAEPKAAVDVAAVIPPPNVVLKGVMMAVPERLSSALLEVNGEVKNYRINDELQNSGFTLVAVDWNTVVIADRNNKPTVITMRQALALDQRGMDSGAISNQPLNGQMTNQMPMPTLPEAPPIDNGAGAVNGSPSAIDEAVTGLQDNPANYLSRMGVMASGEGYQVTAAMPAALRSRLGLEPGDKVLSVNGSRVGNSPSQDATLLQQVQQSKEAQIEVQRGDQTITIRQQF